VAGTLSCSANLQAWWLAGAMALEDRTVFGLTSRPPVSWTLRLVSLRNIRLHVFLIP
jgi:hypothetical protein